MGSPTVALQEGSRAVPALRQGMVRVLHRWHLLSVDAPTVAFLWTLLFAHVGNLAQSLRIAAALAVAVWLIYVADRLLDARAAPRTARTCDPLHAVYGRDRRAFFVVGGGAMLCLALLLRGLPRNAVGAWLLLGIPLLAYAITVHRFHLSPRSKATVVSLLFASGVALQLLVQIGTGLHAVVATATFACVCGLNSAVLRCGRRVVLAIASAGVASAGACLWFATVRSVGAAALGAIVLLCLLWLKGRGLSPLSFRALADLALAAPALVLLAA